MRYLSNMRYKRLVWQVWSLWWLLITLAACMTTRSPTFAWDLSQQHSIADVNWPASAQLSIYAYEHPVHLTIKLPQNQVYQEQVQAFYVTRDGNDVHSITTHTGIMTLDEAYREMGRLIAAYGLDRQDLDVWYAQTKGNAARKASYLDTTWRTIQNNTQPGLVLELLHSFNDEKPWIISYEVAWP